MEVLILHDEEPLEDLKPMTVVIQPTVREARAAAVWATAAEAEEEAGSQRRQGDSRPLISNSNPFGFDFLFLIVAM